MKETINTNTQLNSPEKRAFELRRRAFNLIYSYVERRWHESAGSNQKLDFLKKIIEDTIKIIPEAKEEVKTKVNSLNSIDEVRNLETLLTKATEINIEISTKYLTLAELEKRLQTRQVEEHGNHILSRGLNFVIHKKDNQISLHIPITFFENAQEFLQSFIEGLKVLAFKMVNDRNLQDIKEITGHSTLVTEKHRILEKLGFKVIKDENGKPTKETKISRERLIELYGK